MNKDEIKAFLEVLGYRFDNDWHDWRISWLSYNGDMAEVMSSNLDSVLEYGLQHYLKAELGKHWREMWSLYHDKHALGETEIFTKDEFNRIWKAIGYYEALQDEA